METTYSVRVYLNDTIGGSFRQGVNPESDARYEETRKSGRPAHIPMMDGYAPEDILVESSVSPLTVEATSKLDAAEQVFSLLNRDDRPNGRDERSLSVGDVVEIEGTRMYVDLVGFVTLEEVTA